ncbi:zinc finger protein 778-like isoform X1 [Cydia strobilella]|uniref:zinc finger protein 778-like isoform X1 n=2 Tax=Cydia strobilella TaxID=1100964 RepID=UPI0030048EDA
MIVSYPFARSMSSLANQQKTIRLVNVVPAPKITKIKKEVVEDEEDTVCCRLCGKSFANERALGNHARMEHMDAYASGDPNVWTQELFAGKKARIAAENQLIQQRTEQMLSVMEPTSLTSLASSDVSYIIIKAEDQELAETATVTKRRKVEKAKEKVVVMRKEKEAQPITGPFECLQPSASISGGTCHQIFFSCCEYSAHHRDEHTRRRKGVRCQVCEAPLMSAHSSPHVCQVCGQNFETIDALTDHTNSAHVKLKPYECNLCHKRFTQQGGVAQHMRMHTGDRPFPCTFCPKAFTQKSGLDQHLRIHTKEKPYRCVICDKKFCQSVHLKQHMRTHTHVAPFQCAICQKRFKQSSHLTYHLRAHNANADKEFYVGEKEVVEVEISQDVAMYAELKETYIVGDAWEQKQEQEQEEEQET